MIGVSKYYDKKPVIKNINLSYFYGAKIGVLRLNGFGKSTLQNRKDFWIKITGNPGRRITNATTSRIFTAQTICKR